MKTERYPFRFKDFLDQRRASQPVLSPDGRDLVFTVVQPSWDKNTNIRHIFRVDPGGGEPRQLTNAGTSNADPAFSPDGQYLAFTSNRSGTSQIWLLPSTGGEARQLTRLALGARRPVWFPDGRKLLVISPVKVEAPGHEPVGGQDSSSPGSDGPAPIVAGELMFRHWDSWTEGKVDHLFVVDVATGEARDLVPGPWPVPPRSLTGHPDYAISPDGTEVCFVSLRESEQAWSTNTNLWVIPAEGGTPRRISPWPGCNAFPAYSPDGRYIAYCGMLRAGYESDRREILVHDRRRRTTRELAPGFDRSAGPLQWSPDGSRLCFSAEDSGAVRLFVVPSEGGTPGPITAACTDHSPRWTPDGSSIVFVRETFRSPPEIWRQGFGRSEPVPITGLNDSVMDRLVLNEPEPFGYLGAKGLRIHGFLLKPPGFQEGRKYPVVFLIHGGPQGAWGPDFHERWNLQLFASPGYVVVAINPRGSTGYGQDFVDAIHGEWGGDCYEDLQRGFDYVLDTFEFCDGQRCAAAGASFGGFMVNWIAGHTDRFKCLVSHDGIFNTEMMAWVTDELWFTEWEFDGLPWDSPEAYRRYSPHLHVENMKTPMLVIQGEQDFRCTAAEGLGLFTALQRRGVESRLLYFRDEGHWVVKPRNRQLWWDTVLGWLDAHLRGT